MQNILRLLISPPFPLPFRLSSLNFLPVIAIVCDNLPLWPRRPRRRTKMALASFPPLFRRAKIRQAMGKGEGVSIFGKLKDLPSFFLFSPAVNLDCEKKRREYCYHSRYIHQFPLLLEKATLQKKCSFFSGCLRKKNSHCYFSHFLFIRLTCCSSSSSLTSSHNLAGKYDDHFTIYIFFCWKWFYSSPRPPAPALLLPAPLASAAAAAPLLLIGITAVTLNHLNSNLNMLVFIIIFCGKLRFQKPAAARTGRGARRAPGALPGASWR